MSEPRLAPKTYHDKLDELQPLVECGQGLNMAVQVILSIDKHGKLTEYKVNLQGKKDVS